MKRNLWGSLRVRSLLIVFCTLLPGILFVTYSLITHQLNDRLLILLIGIFSAMTTWIGLETLIILRINALVKLSERLSSGDLTARPGQADYNGPLGQLAHAFDQIFVSMQQQNARLFEETNHRLQRLDALHQIDIAITSNLDLGNTLQILLDHVIILLNVDAACVLIVNPYEQTLEFAANRGFKTDALRQTHLRLGEGYAGRAALEQKSIHIPDLRTRSTDLLRSPSFMAEGFVTYDAVPLVSRGQSKGVLEVFHNSLFEPESEWLNFLEALASQAAIAIENATLFNDLQCTNVELNHAYNATLEGWSRALDLRDQETEGHSQRVTELTLRLARAMSVEERELIHIHRGALLHDIGKLGISDAILLKPGPLTEEERVLIQRHPMIAFELLSPIAYLQPALAIPYCHHEKWDGSGYLRGLKGEQIPLAARIFAVVDVWDALLSDRPYRPGWSKEKARAYIRDGAGSHFDPEVVEVFLSLLNEDKKAKQGE